MLAGLPSPQQQHYVVEHVQVTENTTCQTVLGVYDCFSESLQAALAEALAKIAPLPELEYLRLRLVRLGANP